MKKRTRLLEAGRRLEWTQGLVNPPVARASTCLFPDFATFVARAQDPDGGLYYGRRGTPTHWALLEALCTLEGGETGWLFPSGLAAITGTLLALLEQGDHLLVADSVYGPTRAVARQLLPRYGVEVTFYDPLIAGGIVELIRPNTRVVMVESPGSLTFEVQDIPAIAAAAHERGAVVVADNTWATGLYYPVLDLGADVSLLAATKYVVGHSDVMLGAAIARGDLARRLKADFHLMGWTVGADDAALALRGLRTLDLRLARHDQAARSLASWLTEHPEVARVLHPALPDCPGHAIFKRDFAGASGLFAIVLKRGRFTDLATLVDALTLFGLGYSWGGFESLVLPADPAPIRSATHWQASGPLLRIHVGLEDLADLKADLERALARYAAALDAR